MRLGLTLLAIVLGLVVAVAAFYNAGGDRPDDARNTGPQQQQEASVQPEGESPESQSPAPSPQITESAPAPTAEQDQIAAPTTASPTAEFEALHALPAASPSGVSIGSTIPDSPFKLQVDLTSWGAGVRRIALADYRKTVHDDNPYVILSGTTRYPFAVRSVTINGKTVPLEGVQWQPGDVQTTDTQTSVTYRVTIADAQDRPVADLVRRYTLAVDSYDLKLEQRIINRTSGPLQVAWEQNIQGDLTADDAAYMGDRRMYVTGYFDPDHDPGKYAIHTKNGFVPRGDALAAGDIWYNRQLDPGKQLAWLASENRYFTIVSHMPVAPDAQTADIAALEALYPDVGTVVFPLPDTPKDEKALLFTLGSETVTAPAGGEATFPLAVYAGPRDSNILKQHPYSALHLGQLVRYELTCALCTFQWLAHALLWFLTTIEGLLGDWGVAIIILVAVVRLLLHPITKQAQVGMMKMGKQMQALQPEIEKLKKKYGDDRQRINQEMMKLYREKGINPANMLGCLPMFLQTPIWIALYAMLYLAIELRHEPAFYGVFQWISGGQWQFLADLSSPDHFIQFGAGITIPLPFVTNTINGINILPILMAVVFFFQQKFTTPPPANEQQAQQQKIMKFMVLLFPIFLYSAPSGLTLYILASTTAGVLDSYLVRKHVKQQEEAGTLFEKKPVKPGGFRDRLNKMLEQKQRELMQRQQQTTKKPQRGKRR